MGCESGERTRRKQLRTPPLPPPPSLTYASLVCGLPPCIGSVVISTFDRERDFECYFYFEEVEIENKSFLEFIQIVEDRYNRYFPFHSLSWKLRVVRLDKNTVARRTNNWDNLVINTLNQFFRRKSNGIEINIATCPSHAKYIVHREVPTSERKESFSFDENKDDEKAEMEIVVETNVNGETAETHAHFNTYEYNPLVFDSFSPAPFHFPNAKDWQDFDAKNGFLLHLVKEEQR